MRIIVVMFRSPSNSLNESRGTSPRQVCRAGRGQAVVVTALEKPHRVDVISQRRISRVSVPEGKRALICAGPAMVVETDASAVPVGHFILSRWMAVHDVALDLRCAEPFRLPEAGRAKAALSLLVDDAIEEQGALRAFLMKLAWRDQGQHEALRARVAWGEHYRIAHHVLTHRDKRVADLAASYGLSVAQFRRRCGEVFGRSLKRELRQLRALHALVDLAGSTEGMAERALAAGYASQPHFCNEIKTFVGISPGNIYKAVHQ